MGNKIPTWSAGSLKGVHHSSLFKYTVNTIDGESKPLSEYAGRAVLVVNIASKCGLTNAQVAGLIKLDGEIKEKCGEGKFEVLAFPCRQFADQEFGDAVKTKEFFHGKGFNFPMFEKMQVNGPDTHPIYQFLKYNTPTDKGTHLKTQKKDGSTILEAIGWNYGKFLVDKDGHVVKYYQPKADPMLCLEDVVKVVNGELKGVVCEMPKGNIGMGQETADDDDSTLCRIEKRAAPAPETAETPAAAATTAAATTAAAVTTEAVTAEADAQIVAPDTNAVPETAAVAPLSDVAAKATDTPAETEASESA